MNSVKTRNLLVLIHLFLAAILAPTFIMVAVTGALYLAGEKPSTHKTELELPENFQLNPENSNLEATVQKLLSEKNITIEFETLKIKGNSITTRPTSDTFVSFNQDDGEWSATLHEPTLHYSMMELHKGHGPKIFKIYQIGAGIALFFVILGGLIVGILSKAYRRKTITATILGTIIFFLLAFLI